MDLARFMNFFFFFYPKNFLGKGEVSKSGRDISRVSRTGDKRNFVERE